MNQNYSMYSGPGIYGPDVFNNFLLNKCYVENNANFTFFHVEFVNVSTSSLTKIPDPLFIHDMYFLMVHPSLKSKLIE